MTVHKILLTAFLLILSIGFKVYSTLPVNAASLQNLPSIASEGEPECGDSDGDGECDTGNSSPD
jgi:hypothetical protein